MKTINMTIDELVKLFQYPNGTSLSEAIILSALSINKKKQFLPVNVYRDNAFSKLWQKQFHHGAHWLAQYRSELNQGQGRLAYRVFESPKGAGFEYRIKQKGISKEDLSTIARLKKIIYQIENGNSTIDNNNEETFQQNVSIRQPLVLQHGHIAKPKKNKANGKDKYQRNAGIAKSSLINANYLCQVNNAHLTFINRVTNNNYVEAHHLIPMQFQDDFAYSIDVPENIISLCPNCHRKIHNGTLNDINQLIVSLFDNNRKNLLLQRGIAIEIAGLIKYYK